jgi:hypothetical protein
MPVDIGGIDVMSEMHMPPMLLPISIAQIATGTPGLKSPGNISALKDTMLAIRMTDAIRPAIVSVK